MHTRNDFIQIGQAICDDPSIVRGIQNGLMDIFIATREYGEIVDFWMAINEHHRQLNQGSKAARLAGTQSGAWLDGVERQSYPQLPIRARAYGVGIKAAEVK